MQIEVYAEKAAMGVAAAQAGAKRLRQALRQRGEASIIVATGASQFEMLEALVREPDIAWNRVRMFHLDEYVGLSVMHPASFRKYLWERFITKLPLPLREYYLLDGEGDCEQECRRVGEAIASTSVAVAFVGIGENGHLAFNDPPADFEAERPYLVVELDEKCRQQQLGEGWFASLDEVPRMALTMSVKQIMKSEAIVCTVPDQRKAEAVQNAVSGPVDPGVPASILQTHPAATIYLDRCAASLLDPKQVG
ncbi:MAG: glucosamine-6-phosphate deaminase [Planctomycetales bacterium]|nr:glucosamine-6-phosphate deaminase [Planctomycetales bacterium]